jgi:Ca2+-binding RTX toxin-like protein
VGKVMAVAMAATTLAFMAQPANAVTDENPDFMLIEQDLEHILKQIQIAEAHAAGGRLLCDTPTDTSGKCVTDPALPLGLRTVDGSYNNLLNPDWGSSDQPFPKLLPAQWRTAEAVAPGVPPAMANQSGEMDVCGGSTTCYSMTEGFVYDTKPRMISNLIVDSSDRNPAAVNAFNAAGGEEAGASNVDGEIFIPNTAPDEALSAPFNAWFTFFGQFFDHGLDLVNKGGNGTIVIPLNADDPLVTHGQDGIEGNGDEVPPNRRFLTLTRATRLPGPDGQVGTADDTHNNQTTPFIDQNQTYTSHPSHQTFLREYVLGDHDGDAGTPDAPMATGRLLDSPEGGLPTWNDVKNQARNVLGINLVDRDVLNVPMLVTDLYGNFTRGPNGFPQIVLEDETTREGTLAGDGASTDNVMKTNHAFLDDIANGAAPAPDADPAAPPGYDNVLLGEHFVTGDGRGNENIGLTAVHHVFHSEHNRMVGEIMEILDKPENAELKKAFQGLDNDYDELMGEPLPDGPEADDWSYEQRLFQAAKFPTEMQYQHLVFEEFARKVQPAIDAIVLNENSYDATINPAIKAEFAHVVYRFGHSMLTEDIDRYLPGRDDIEGVSLLDGFLNPETYDNNGALTPDEAAGAVINGTTNQVGAQIDEMITSTLRNNLLGLPLDLATINIARSRDAGVPPLQVARKTFFEESGDPMLEPYSSWVDFGLSLKNGDNFGRETDLPNASLVNFVAAYGTHPTITAAATIEGKRTAADLIVNHEMHGAAAPSDSAAFMNSTGASWSVPNGTNTGLERVDFWVGGLAEALEPFGSMLGSTFNYVFEQQLEDLQFGDRFYYLFRNQGNQLFSGLEGNSFSGLIQRNTDASLLPADIFAVQDPYLDLENLPTPWPAGLSQMPDGTYRWDGDEHIEIHGNRTTGDKIRAGQGDDALWGYGGNDRIEGGSGNDSHIGGPGDDILTDTFGDDNIKGGLGNDAIKGGAGDDLLLPGHGDDYVATGNDFKTVFGSTGDDVILGGLGRDTIFAGEDDDWIEGGAHADLMQGDNANQFQNNPFGGNDIIDGGAGNDDMEGEGGHDILIGRQNGTDRMEGMHGYDWVTYRGETTGVDVDLRFSVLQRPDQQAIRDRFDLVEGISGGAGNDVLRGMGRAIDDIPDVDLNEHKMTDESIAQITGLGQLLDPGHVQDYGDRFTEQSIGFDTDGVSNLLLGGSGSDIFETRVGDDFVDGDAYLDVFMRANGVRYNNPSATALQNGIFNGTINPGDINIFRQIRTDPGQGDVLDTAVFAADSSQYTINNLGDGYWEVVHNLGDGEAEEAEGQDILRNVELLRFSDGCFVLETMEECGSFGEAEITFTGDSPVEDVPVTGTVSINLADVPNPQEIQFRWMATDFEDINGQADWLTAAVQPVNKAADCTQAGDVLTCTKQFTPGDAENDTGLRLEVTFTDAGVLRSIISPVTTVAVLGLNDPPSGPVLSTNDPMEGKRISVSGLVDDDGLEEAGETLQWQWQVEDTPGNWATVATNPFNITGFIPDAEHVGKRLRVQVVYDDDAGFSNTATSAVTNPVASFVADPTAPAAPSIAGVTVIDADSIEVSWQAPDNDGGSPITEYVVTAWQGNQIVDDRVVAADATSVVFNGLTDGTNYRFSVTARNAVGLGMESGLSEPVSPHEVLAIVSTSPANGATGVNVTTSLEIFFSEEITGWRGSNVTLHRLDNLGNVVGDEIPFTRGFTSSDNRLLMNPYGRTTDHLAPGTAYRIALNGIRSLDGTPLESTTVTFTTEGQAVPTVVSTNPANGATGVNVTTSLEVFFSEEITGWRGSNVMLHRLDDDGNVIGGEIPFTRGFTAGDNRLLMNPYGRTTEHLAPDARYRITLTGGPTAIRGLSGLPLTTTEVIFRTAP